MSTASVMHNYNIYPDGAVLLVKKY